MSMTQEAGFQRIRKAAEELDRQQQRLSELHAALSKKSTKVASEDRSVTVELDAAGEVRLIRFNSQKFRRMAPAELGAILVDTIRKARAQSREQILSAFRKVIPAGHGGLDDLLAGKPDFDKMFAEARQQASELLASVSPAADAAPPEKGAK
jgi:DNA-binding protein YbaB